MNYTARRCSDCAIGYPNYITICKVCGEATWGMAQTPPDDDWEESVARLLGQPNPEDSIYPHPEAAVAQRWKWNDRLWFKHEDLLRAGYLYLETGQVILVNAGFYELEGYSHQHEAWWVAVIETEGAFEDATPEAIIEAE